MNDKLDTQKYILFLNEQYRIGTPKVTDEMFDRIVNDYLIKYGKEAHDELITLLFEKVGSVKHDYVIGSLKKCTYGTTGFADWIKKFNVRIAFVSPKLDGMSVVCTYDKGKLVSAATRGNGELGENITDKAQFISDIPKTIDYRGKLSLRAELLITQEGADAKGYQNRRNGTVGVIGRKECTDDLKYIECYFHGVLGNISIEEQIQILERHVPRSVEFQLVGINMIETESIENYLRVLVIDLEKNDKFICDGLVVYKEDYVNENVLHPNGVIAFKVPKEGVVTNVKGIDWKTSKNGNIKPVVLLEPVYIDGTTVSRATGYNYKFIVDNRIGLGASVKILKAGEIIPKIIEVLAPGQTLETIECPSCGHLAEVSESGVELYCPNEECEAQGLRQLTHFLRNCDVKGANEKSLVKWNIGSFESLAGFKPDPLSKNQMTFSMELQKKVFSLSPSELFAKMSFSGSGEKTITKLIEANGSIEQLVNGAKLYVGQSVPGAYSIKSADGVGDKTIDNICFDIIYNAENLDIITSDARYNYVEKETVMVNKLNGKTFCITGTLKRGRKEVEKDIIDNGGKIASVSKTLNYLVVGSDAGSKLTKAMDMGIMVINETQLMDMIK